MACLTPHLPATRPGPAPRPPYGAPRYLSAVVALPEQELVLDDAVLPRGAPREPDARLRLGLGSEVHGLAGHCGGGERRRNGGGRGGVHSTWGAQPSRCSRSLKKSPIKLSTALEERLLVPRCSWNVLHCSYFSSLPRGPLPPLLSSPYPLCFLQIKRQRDCGGDVSTRGFPIFYVLCGDTVLTLPSSRLGSC